MDLIKYTIQEHLKPKKAAVGMPISGVAVRVVKSYRQPMLRLRHHHQGIGLMPAPVISTLHMMARPAGGGRILLRKMWAEKFRNPSHGRPTIRPCSLMCRSLIPKRLKPQRL